MNELRRRVESAKNWGIDSRLVTPAEIKEMIPFIGPALMLAANGYAVSSITMSADEKVALTISEWQGDTARVGCTFQRHSPEGPSFAELLHEDGSA